MECPPLVLLVSKLLQNWLFLAILLIRPLPGPPGSVKVLSFVYSRDKSCTRSPAGDNWPLKCWVQLPGQRQITGWRDSQCGLAVASPGHRLVSAGLAGSWPAGRIMPPQVRPQLACAAGATVATVALPGHWGSPWPCLVVFQKHVLSLRLLLRTIWWLLQQTQVWPYLGPQDQALPRTSRPGLT